MNDKDPAFTLVVKRYRIVKTTFIYAAYVTYGMGCSLMGPAIPDLLEQLHITEEQMGIAGSINSLVATGVAMGMGPMMARFQSKIDIMHGLGFLCAACAFFIIPNTSIYWVFITANILQSASFSTIDQSSNLMILNLWGKSNAAMQGLHAVWSLGLSIGPFVIRPFLGPDTHLLENNNVNVSTTNHTDQPIGSRIHIAYTISSGLLILSCLGSFISFMNGFPKGLTLHLKPVESCKTMCQCKKHDRDSSFAIFILVCFCLYYFLNACEDNFISMWLVTYAVKSDMKFSKKDATLLDAAGKFSFLIARMTASLIAIKVRVQIMIFVVVYGVLGSLIGLALLGSIYRPCLWVFTCLFTAFCAPKWPCGIAWTNTYVTVTGANYILINFGAGIGWMFISWLNGWLFTNRSPNDVIFVPIYIGAVLCLELIVMQVVASRHGPRKEKDEDPSEEMEQLVVSEGNSESEEIEHFTFK